MRRAIISDIHSNLPALEAVLADLGAVDQIWCLGDLVGYGPDPGACIEAVRAQAALIIGGNHDLAAAGRVSASVFNPDAQAALRWNAAQLSAAESSFLAALSPAAVADGYALAHGSPHEPVWEYLLSMAAARRSFAAFSERICFVGHTHVPLVFRFQAASDTCEAIRPEEGQPVAWGNDRFIVNPGSVGQPRDGDSRAAYALVDDAEGTVVFRRVAYPIAAVQRRMAAVGLPSRLVARLQYGW